jgi:hypothetical protein
MEAEAQATVPISAFFQRFFVDIIIGAVACASSAGTIMYGSVS